MVVFDKKHNIQCNIDELKIPPGVNVTYCFAESSEQTPAPDAVRR